MQATTYNTAVIEPHPILRMGLESQVSRSPALRHQGSWTNSADFCQSEPAWQPSIILVGNYNPEQPVGAAINLLKERFPSAAIAVCLNEANRGQLETLLHAGALGVLGIDCVGALFDQAMDLLCQSKAYISPAIKEAIIDTNFRESTSIRPHPKGSLSPREREVLEYVATGKSTRKIALDMDISFKTVQTLVRRIKIKKGLNTFGELLTYARQSQETQAQSAG